MLNSDETLKSFCSCEQRCYLRGKLVEQQTPVNHHADITMKAHSLGYP